MQKQIYKKIVLLSGGLDSTTCLAMAVEKFGLAQIIALNMYYGQRHDREIISARKVAEHYGVEYQELDLAEIMKFSDCSLLKHSTQKVAHGSYAEQSDGEKPVATYVPFRNGLFLSVATAFALSMGADEVWYGAHKDDATGSAYPDCSKEFIFYMDCAIKEGTANQVKIRAPFADCNKADIVREGLSLGVPYELTWSCYEGGEKPCGKCGTCIDRRKAFEANGLTDPVL